MSEKKYKKKYEFQKKLILRQTEQIESLKNDVQRLEMECKEKDRIIHSVDSLRQELNENVETYKKLKNEYRDLIEELRKMKTIINQEVYRGRWKLIKFLIK
jgi:ribosomal protein L16 Arg81 hydroxylase